MGFTPLTAAELKDLISYREGEKKLGEQLKTVESLSVEQLKNINSKYVIFGVSEDIGPRANYGLAGAASAWKAFLPKFVNMQSNHFLNGDDCIIIGELTFNQLIKSAEIDQLRSATKAVDEAVSNTLDTIYKAEKIPILIGGGHNNCYSLLKALASNTPKKFANCINLDPHADFRALEGRHSGNGFSYAFAEGYLNNYAVIGLHEGYNSQSMYQELNDKKVHFSTYESIFIREEVSFSTALSEGLATVNQSAYGVELDLDAVENIAASAQTPSGVSVSDARKYVHYSANHPNAAYLHLCEAAPALSSRPDQVGKLLAYLVADFIKSKNNQLK
jgi:formiminoglutamase